MALIRWDKHFVTGLPDIDAQHRRWLRLLDNLDTAWANDSPEIIKRIKHESLDAMIEYTNYHFNYEERVMVELDYPELGTHISAHGRLTEQLLGIRNDFRLENRLVRTEAMDAMTVWLKNHILKLDKKIGAFAAHRI